MRATKLAELLQDHHTTVRLMDGHGRFLCLFMLAVVERHGSDRLNTLRFELVDIDKGVNEWHMDAFKDCQFVKCVQKDILSLPLNSDTLLYLNFCGLGNSKAALRTFLQAGNPCTVSACTSRGASSIDGYLSGIGNCKKVKPTDGKPQRGNFVTYAFNAVAA